MIIKVFIVIAIIIVISVICEFCLYFITRNKIKNKAQESVKEELAIMHQELLQKNKEITEKTTQILELNRQCTKQTEAYNSAIAAQDENLKKLYNDKRSMLDEQFKTQTMEANIAIENINNKLSSLSRQYSKAVEFEQREKEPNIGLEYNTIAIDKSDKSDIELLQSIQYKLKNPRIVGMVIWQTFYQPIAKSKFVSILGSEDICGIYKITNINNNKCYIGQSKNIKNRWFEHCKKACGIDTPKNNKLYKAMMEDGISNFAFELIEECEEAEMDEKERYYIQFFNSVDYGYNTLKGNK